MKACSKEILICLGDVQESVVGWKMTIKAACVMAVGEANISQ